MTSSTLANYTRLLIAISTGSVIFFLGQNLITQLILGGANFYITSGSQLITAITAWFVIAASVGFLTFGIMRGKSEFPVAILSLIALIKAFWLINGGLIGHPVWFEILATINIILGLWMGRFLWRLFNFKFA